MESASSKSESVTQTAGSRGSNRGNRSVSAASLRAKVAVVILTSAVGGGIVGILEARLGHQVWFFCLGLTVVVVALLWLANCWVWHPVELLIRKLSQLANREGPFSIDGVKPLEVDGQDEIGRLCRLIHKVVVAARRDHFEANQLRRTLDHRISKATHLATKKLQQMTMRDPLTDLGNRRFLEENLPQLVRSVLESETDLSCIMIDMDNFKQINDSLGHASGDKLLIALSELIAASTRSEDYAVRLGGDEFAILMAACKPLQAYRFAEQLQVLFRQRIRSILPDQYDVDLSMGIASMRQNGVRDGYLLLEKADANLYAAKHAGKGRIVGFPPANSQHAAVA